MSLKPVESKSLETFFKTGAFVTPGFWHRLSNLNQDPPASGIVYYDRLDVMLAVGHEKKLIVDQPGTVQFDPAGLDNTSPRSRFVARAASSNPSRLHVGEWDRTLNVQKLYGSTTDTIFEISTTTYELLDTGPSVYPGFSFVASTELLANTGGWDESGAESRGDWTFFETWGFALKASATVRHTDGTTYRGLALVDLSDSLGRATLVDIPTVFTNAPGALFERPAFDGSEFNLSVIQFVPDDDSTPAIPKGRLFLSSAKYLGDGNTPSSNNRQYLKVAEWNPFSVTATPGNPNRVHLRELIMTRLNFIQREAFGTNPTSLGDHPDGGSPAINANLRMRYHPPSRTLLTHNDTQLLAFENERGFVRTSFVPVLNSIEPPSQQEEVETNKVVRFRTRALGDLGDPIAGLDAVWALERRSTVRENLNTTGSPVSSFVANPPIDTGTLVVEKEGPPGTFVVMVLTTDYTVNEATGEITWAGAQVPPDDDVFFATYLHSGVTATPPHGTLLDAIVRTDEFGNALTRVEYPDNDLLAGHRDFIDVTVSDD